MLYLVRRKLMSKRKTIEEYKEQVKKVWGDRYTIPPYSVYNGTHSNITVTCPIHGDFEVEAKSFLYGHGCKKCANEKKHNNNNLLTEEEVIKNLKEVLGDTYLLDKVGYYNARTKIYLGCRKHGYFPIRYHDALNLHGCPFCKQSRAEILLKKTFEDEKIYFFPQHSFDWMKTSTYGKLSYDFYLPKYNIAVECQGRQHFESVDAFGGETEFKKVLERDKKKVKLTNDYGIKLIFFIEKRFNKYMNEGDVYFNNVDDLIKYIKDYEIRTT